MFGRQRWACEAQEDATIARNEKSGKNSTHRGWYVQTQSCTSFKSLLFIARGLH